MVAIALFFGNSFFYKYEINEKNNILIFWKIIKLIIAKKVFVLQVFSKSFLGKDAGPWLQNSRSVPVPAVRFRDALHPFRCASRRWYM